MDKDSKKEQTKQCTIPSVSGSITVYKGRADRYRDIYSKSSWFDNSEYFVIQDDSESLIIKKCYMEIPKKAQKFTKARHFQFVSELPLGTFDIDEDESNEDELVIYYR
jgi:hypothetical protein